MLCVAINSKYNGTVVHHENLLAFTVLSLANYMPLIITVLSLCSITFYGINIMLSIVFKNIKRRDTTMNLDTTDLLFHDKLKTTVLANGLTPT